MLKAFCNGFLEAGFKSIQVQQTRFKYNRYRIKYLKKANIVMVDKEGTFHFEGVSNKQHPIHVPWLEPEHVPCHTPGEEGSGDLEGNPEVDRTRPTVFLAKSSNWETASADSKKILSLEFQRTRDRTEVLKNDLLRTIQEHELDDSSLPCEITKLTISIRSMQRDLRDRYPHENRRLLRGLENAVKRRRNMISLLRHTDYKKYEWLLEKLNLVYKPLPFEPEKLKRKIHQERIIDLWCDEMRHFKLKCLKNDMESQQPVFLREKADKLRWIIQQEKDLGLDPSVTEGEIVECEKRAEELESRLKTRSAEWPYLVLEQEVKKDKHVFLN